MDKILNLLKTDTNKLKEKALKRAMIKYYNTINQGKVSIPSFILADIEVNQVKKAGRIDELYASLIRSRAGV